MPKRHACEGGQVPNPGSTYCWLRFCCCTCWICCGAGRFLDGSMPPGMPGRDTGLFPYPGGPMAGPCGVIRLDGGIPGLYGGGEESSGLKLATDWQSWSSTAVTLLSISFAELTSAPSNESCRISLSWEYLFWFCLNQGDHLSLKAKIAVYGVWDICNQQKNEIENCICFLHSWYWREHTFSHYNEEAPK